jgi:omega-3 fatty acid desaturase (delta-15 desaturase)
MFVEGHDCGHGSFSNYTYINDFIGHLCHAPLCVPFHGWRISHRAHHQHHNDIEHDHSWVPIQRSDFKSIPNFPNKFARFSPILLILYPVYLLQESNTGGFSGNHFNPFSPMFQKSERLGAAISSMTVIVFLGTLLKNLLLTDFLYYYAGPYVIFIIWLALVTYLQHTDEKGLYFKGASWDYLRAALSTFDRTYSHLIDPFNLGYGWILDHLHHNISDAHVVHHLFFTAIPHYRLKEATAAIIPILGKHYNFDPTPLPKAFWRSVTRCNFVPDDNEPSS